MVGSEMATRLETSVHLHEENTLSGHPKPANDGHLKTGQR
jgi:hypothetical protein